MRIATLASGSPAVDSGNTVFSLIPAARGGQRLARGGLAGVVLCTALLGLSACQPGDTSSTPTTQGAAEADTVAAAGDAVPAADEASQMFDTDEKKASYAMGYGVTRQVTDQFGDVVDHDAFVAGA